MPRTTRAKRIVSAVKTTTGTLRMEKHRTTARARTEKARSLKATRKDAVGRHALRIGVNQRVRAMKGLGEYARRKRKYG